MTSALSKLKLSSKTRPQALTSPEARSRLGNFPALETRADVSQSRKNLPLDLVLEELTLSDERRVLLRERSVLLTGFQHELWSKLGEGRSLAVSAPTSAGKSFVLQGHLTRVFDDGEDRTVVYLVPTRALIAQVSRDLADVFAATAGAPEIMTVPLDSDQQLPRRSILVMTQERVQLMLMSHSDLNADVIIVDEAHSIADRGRGVLLQWVVDDLLRRRPVAQLLFASPGIRNLEVFGRTFGLDNVESIPSKEPTVAQNFLIVRVTSVRHGGFSVSSVEPSGEPRCGLRWNAAAGTQGFVSLRAFSAVFGATRKERTVRTRADKGLSAET